jgi:hypothetical protein
LHQAEAIANSNPLTTVSGNVKDLLPFTPAHIVIGHAIQAIPDYW